MQKDNPQSTSYQSPPTTDNLSELRVAIVHDWFVGGGAEKVVEQLHLMFPDAPIYTSYCNDEWRKRLDGKVITGYLQHWPFSKLRKFLPLLRQLWFGSLDLSEFDLIISSTGNGEAKFIRVKPPTNYQSPTTNAKRTFHVTYCHTPTHFYWRHYDAYLSSPGFGIFNGLARIGLKILAAPLRKADYNAAQRVDHFIANSSHIASDIKQYYDREATVIFPPVNTNRFSQSTNSQLPTTKARHGFVTVGRLVPNKRVDLIIKACNQLKAPLKIVGRGPELKKLKKLAGPTISFITNASDSEVSAVLASAEAFVFAGFEDFGIAPVEALASGTPVIAYRGGGALNYVVEGKTGEFFNDQTTISLAAALNSFKPANYNHSDIKNYAEKFSNQNFQKNLSTFLEKTIKN